MYIYIQIPECRYTYVYMYIYIERGITVWKLELELRNQNRGTVNHPELGEPWQCPEPWKPWSQNGRNCHNGAGTTEPKPPIVNLANLS